MLLIEDDPAERRIIERLLGQKHAITWCADHRTAREQLASRQHDVWLIDYFLPGVDGLSLLAEARRSDPHTAAILLTGARDPRIDRRAIELGAAARLDKSGLSADRLSRAIDFAVHHARALAGLAEREALFRAALDAESDGPGRLVQLARVERELRATLAFDAIELDPALFFGRLVEAGLSVTGCTSGFIGRVEDGRIRPEALIVAQLADGPLRRLERVTFAPAAGTALSRAIVDEAPVFEPDGECLGLAGWPLGATLVLPVMVGARVGGVVALSGGDGPPTAGHMPVVEAYRELCAGALLRFDIDSRRRRAEDELQRCDRLLRAVTGLARLLPSRVDESRALADAARVLGRTTESARVLIAQRGPSGDWYRRVWWPALADDADSRAFPLLDAIEASGVTAARPQPVSIDHGPGRAPAVVVPVLVPAAGETADGAAPMELWGAIALVECPLDPRNSTVSGILQSAGRALGGHLGQLAARQAIREAEALRRASDSARLEAEARFRALVERSDDILLLLDAEGRVAYQSPSMQATLGWSVDDLDAARLAERMHLDDVHRWQAALGRVARDAGASAHCEVRVRHARGEWRLLDLSVRNALDDPAVGGLVANARDITAHRQMWDRVLRTHKIESLGRLAAGLAHEFNNLLTVVLTSAVIGADALPPDHPARADLEAIGQAAESGAGLIRRLLMFASAQPVTLRPVRVSELLDRARPLWRGVLGDGLALDVKVEPDVGYMYADAHQLEQVLLAMVLNARDASSGQGRLVISARVATGPAADDIERARRALFVVLSLADDGAGMTADVQRRIFEPFFTTRGRVRGAGLGLAVAFGIVRRHRGRILVDSAPGRGTTFEVWIPATTPPMG